MRFRNNKRYRNLFNFVILDLYGFYYMILEFIGLFGFTSKLSYLKYFLKLNIDGIFFLKY